MKNTWKKKLGRLALAFGLLLGLSVFWGTGRAEAKAFDYIIPDSDSRYLTAADLEGMSAQVVCYAKNEIYARHGRQFVSQELTEYFEEQPWYYGTVSPSSFSPSVFNQYETANVQLLSDTENKLSPGGYPIDQPGYDFTAVYTWIYGGAYAGFPVGDYYIIPDSDSRYIDQSEVAGLTLQEICYAKNEIYARRGRQFVSQELTDYFNAQTWYYGFVAPEQFSDSVFNAYEAANVGMLSNLEFSLAANGYQLDQPGYNIYAVIENDADDVHQVTPVQGIDEQNVNIYEESAVLPSAEPAAEPAPAAEPETEAPAEAANSTADLFAEIFGSSAEEPEEETAAEINTAEEEEYIFADSDSRYLTEDELEGLSLQTLYYAKCEIYARRGRVFDTQELQDYFGSKSWYEGSLGKGEFSTSVFNKYEKANVLLLDDVEHELDPNGYKPK